MSLPPPVALPRFARRFWPVWLAGLLGVGALLLQPPAPALLAQAPELQALPPLAVRALLLINPLLLMTLLALAGAAFAHRAGLYSALAGTLPHAAAPWRRALGRALAAGLVLGLGLGLVDRLLTPWLGPEWQQLQRASADAPALVPLLTGLLYGGLAEEVMMRWGVMSLLLAGLLALTRQPPARVPAALAWTAITLAALLFAAGHLPALAQLVTPSPGLVLRTLGLNLAAGLLYGWLFWRRGLEVAMAAHAASHVGLALVRLL